jgi:ribosomal protein S2
MDGLLTAEQCLSKAQEYFTLAEGAPDDTVRKEYLLLAKELTKLAAILDGSASD